jgi:hypothetical protein
MKIIRMRVGSSMVGVAILGMVLFGASAAFGASTQKGSGGAVDYFEVSSSATGTAAAVITGAITDYGVDHVGIADNGNVSQIVLQKGSFEVNVSALNKADIPVLHGSTCSFTVQGSASATLLDGTGAHAGIKGKIKITSASAGILPRLQSGKCNQSNSAVPLDIVRTARGSGAVSFP